MSPCSVAKSCTFHICKLPCITVNRSSGVMYQSSCFIIRLRMIRRLDSSSYSFSAQQVHYIFTRNQISSSCCWSCCDIRDQEVYLMATFLVQNSTLCAYFAGSIGTPDPPYSLPSALRIMVIGCIGYTTTHHQS
jgi:hypothetical protein